MAPTSDERREVAARLRLCARETNGTSDFAMYLNHWVGVGNANVGGQFSVKSDRKTAEMTLETLADLIDPKCHMEYGGHVPDSVKDALGVYFCSECGSPIYNDMEPTYCPNCGARVVSSDDNQ